MQPSAACQSIDLKVRADYQYSSYELNRDQGLRSNFVEDLIQDKKGYIWVVAGDWIQRYNGNNFETFFEIPKPQGFENRLWEDEEGKIWLVSYVRNVRPFVRLFIEDIWLIDPERRLTQAWEGSAESRELGVSIDAITGIGQSLKHGSLLLGLQDGRVVNANSGQQVARFPVNQPVFDIKTNHAGSICLSSGNQIYLQDRDGNELSYTALEQQIVRTVLNEDNEVMCRYLGEDEPWREAFSKETSFSFFSLDAGAFPQEDNEISIRNDSFWLTRNTLFRMGDTAPLAECSNCPKLFLDRQNNIWSSNFAGLSVFRLHPRRFETLLTGRNAATRGVLPLDDSLLLVHTFKGAYIVDLHDSIRHFEPELDSRIGMVKDPATGRIWQGAYGWELSSITNYRNALEFERIRDPEVMPVDNYPICPYFSPSGDLWLGQQKGLRICTMDREGLPENCREIDHAHLRKATVHYLHEEDGRLWAATSSGLFELDLNKKEVIRHHKVLGALDINHYTRDGATIWFSTYQHGLIKWEYGAPDYLQISLAEEGPYMEIPSLCGIYDDGLGYLWAPSNLGLYRIEKSRLLFQRYDSEQYIAHSEFNYYSHARLPDGRLVFGGLNGLTLVNPALMDILDRKEPPFSLELTNGMISHLDQYRSIALENGEEITLLGQQENLQLDVNLLDFRSFRKGQIMYMLEGINGSWNPLEGKTLRLERIPFGRYVLKIKALTYDNLSNGNEWEIPVCAIKPWYLTPWFLGLLITGVFAGGAGMVSRRYHSVRRKKIFLEELVKKRTQEIETNKNFILHQNEELRLLNDYKNKIIAIIGHDLRGPVLGLSRMGQKMKYMQAQGDVERIIAVCSEHEKQIDHLRILIDNILAWSLVQKKSNMAFDQKAVSLRQSLIDQVELLQPEAERKDQLIQIRVEEDSVVHAPGFILGVLIRNLVANSIRYSGNGSSILLEVGRFQGYSCLSIRDEGPGMPAPLLEALNRCREMKIPFGPESEKGLGLGLWICSSLLVRLNGRWSFEQRQDRQGLKARLWFTDGQPQRKDVSVELPAPQSR